MRWLSVCAAGSGLFLLGVVVHSQNRPRTRTVTVSQGTSMAVAVSPDGTRLAIDLQGTIWTLPASGGNATRITDTLHDARQPAWSPDGERLAFQSYRNGTWDIWTVHEDGSGASAVTTGPFDDREPHWSPDGARIAFSSDRSGNYDIWVLELASRQLTQLTRDEGNDYWPAWSPDGRTIAFVASRETGRGIRVVDLEGTERMLVPSDQILGAPAWTPDGRTVVFSAFGAGVTRLVTGDREISATEDVFPFRPQWTPSASLIYTADGQIKERVQLDAGGSPRVIPFRATFSLARATYAPRPRDFDATSPQRALGVVRPSLSPDGEQIVFAALGDIWTARRGGSAARLTDDPAVDTDPAWSPDGTRIAYASDRHGSFDLYVRNALDGSERRITTASTAEMLPTWSPEGSRLTFVTFGGLASGRLSIVDLSSGAIRTVLETTGPLSAGWSPDGRTIYASVLHPSSSRFREGVDQVLAIPADARSESAERVITLVPDVSTGKRGEGPAWSPDGRHVAAVIGGELHVIPLGPTGEPAGAPRAMGTSAADQLSWSADSTHILFSENDRVKLIPIDGRSAPREWPLDLTYTRAVREEAFVVHAGRLVDGVRPDGQENIDILITRNRITRVVPHDDAEHRGRVVDASHLTVMPGLMEAHGHYSAEYGQRFGLLHLAYGITSVRSPGGHPYASLEQREAVDAGRRPGPRLFTAGYLVDGSRIYYPMATPAPTEAAVDREIERARLLKLDLFKTYVRMPDMLQQRAVEGAHRIGIPASSHEIYPAAAFGIDSVEHLAATSRRGYSPKQSLLGRAYEDVTALASGAGMTITPTLALGGLVRRILGESPGFVSDPRWQLLPEWSRAPLETSVKSPSAPGSPQPPKTMMAYHRAGVRIIAGTDAPIVPYGIALHIELEQYTLAGMTAFEALQTATINVARALNVARDLGSVEPGKLADLTIVEGNPLADIRAARHVRMVMVNGILLRVEDLTAAAR
ncbi:MAG TPA: amidohydrolase family protein [Vicinamibacterales bacterium]|nr:amidohydrolase family protein [Vicinamibacterales bacterium]